MFEIVDDEVQEILTTAPLLKTSAFKGEVICKLLTVKLLLTDCNPPEFVSASLIFILTFVDANVEGIDHG